MEHPEVIVLCLNVVIICIAYFIIYPKFCGSNGNKIVNNDLLASGVVLIVSGSVFWGTGQEFSMLFFSLNWFWFTLLTYGIMEIPLMLWYFKKHDVWSSFKV